MRRNKYTCDICGKDITPLRRPISLPGGGKVTSSHESIQQITLAQIDVNARNYVLSNEQLSKTYDVCDACWDAMVTALRSRKKGDIDLCH